MKTCKLLLLALCCGCGDASAAGKAGSEAPRIVNIVNFIRNIEPRSEEITETVLYETVARQAAQLAEYGLPATFLLQYDALINPRYRQLLTQDVYPGTEVGGWWEITQPHVEAAGLKWRGRYPWDWHADVGFATGYTPEERRKLVDVYMEKFKEVFGKYPTAIGSWFIDAYTLGYMYDKYGIVASCNCKDQIGTDGYTLWGGYWNQAYYPSRVNAYMPAQTREGQIPVPVFRMLGSDPIYQYDNCVGGALQGVISLEPVYGDSGGSRQWVEWFFRSMFEEPCLAFAYTQAGQENSFTWGSMEKGLNIQIPLLANRFRKGEIRVETLTRSGEWFRENFPVTPPTAVTALTDYRERIVKPYGTTAVTTAPTCYGRAAHCASVTSTCSISGWSRTTTAKPAPPTSASIRRCPSWTAACGAHGRSWPGCGSCGALPTEVWPKRRAAPPP